MEKHILPNNIVHVVENNIVEPLIYIDPNVSVNKGLIWSNKNQKKEDIQPEIWNFHVYIYQICENWLKAHENYLLKKEDTQHYMHLIMLSKEIFKLTEEIKIAIQYNQLKKLEIFEKVRAIVVDKLGIEPSLVTPVVNFVNDLGTNSLDTLELVLALEKAFDIKIPHASAKSLLTVQQVIDYLAIEYILC